MTEGFIHSSIHKFIPGGLENGAAFFICPSLEPTLFSRRTSVLPSSERGGKN
jgi:hypothetical protein